jgi:adenylate cyclase
MKINSIQVKIVSLIIFILILIIITVLFITVNNQRESLLESTQRNLSTNTEILNRVIRNIMLNGEAPIAVNTMNNLREIEEFKELTIYRIDGTSAFNDYSTVEFVNSYQDLMAFQKTPRAEYKTIDNPSFIKVLQSNVPTSMLHIDAREMEYFYPILNYSECNICHGERPFIRGVAHFKVSVQGVFSIIGEGRTQLIIVFLVSGIIGAVLLTFVNNRIIIRPILSIGNTVKEVGEGNLGVNADIKSKDEFGDLAQKINTMTKGLRERLRLSKFVSKSTDEFVRQEGSEDETATRKTLTLLFSDIRGFTTYSEQHDPDFVIEQLNKVLDVQARVVHRFGGDIDKFVGDEIMAIFKDPYTAVKCAYEMMKAVAKLDKLEETTLRIGIGINTGEVVTGTIGSLERREYAVIGDTVNLAARLCSIAKKNMILLSESANSELKGKIESKLIANQKIKGKKEAVNFYALLKVK